MDAERKGRALNGIEGSARTAHRDDRRGRIGDLDGEQLSRLAAVEDHCPVRRVLGDSVHVTTRVTARRPATTAGRTA